MPDTSFSLFYQHLPLIPFLALVLLHRSHSYHCSCAIQSKPILSLLLRCPIQQMIAFTLSSTWGLESAVVNAT